VEIPLYSVLTKPSIAIEHQSAHAIAALAQTGVNTINAQVFAFDAKLTQFERNTAKVMAERLRQSQLRIQQYS
jgi:hypothetical protein